MLQALILLPAIIFALQGAAAAPAASAPAVKAAASAEGAQAKAGRGERSRSRKSRRPQCGDGKDNDRDARIDYPRDPGCRNRRDNSEGGHLVPIRPLLSTIGRLIPVVSEPAASPAATAAVPPVTSTDPTPTLEPLPSVLGPFPTPQEPGVVIGEAFYGRQVFPSDNPWNQDISGAAIDPNSDTLIATIGSDTALHASFGTFWQGVPNGIPYMAVGASQPGLPVVFGNRDESDNVLYPIPKNPAIEGGAGGIGDRHILVIDRDRWFLYELYHVTLLDGLWHAEAGAFFNLNSNALRPLGTTSADAAGLPIFPGLVRYDEVYGQGIIRHALRFTATRTRKAFVYPARHYASFRTEPEFPPMGMRVRLKSSFDINPFPYPVQVILQALKTYGMFLADNGNNWYVSGAPDERWNDDELGLLQRVKGRDLEVIKMDQIMTPEVLNAM